MRTNSKADLPVRRPLIIAHRGASGYLPEHTLSSKALAFAMGADFLEQDVVATRDQVPIVFHDIYLDAVTNVADVFPGRAREDGRHYCVDFDLGELRQLSVRERIDPDTGKAIYPGRYPRSAPGFPIPTLREELGFIAGLSASTGRAAGIYPEIKDPEWHHHHGIDLAELVIECLEDFGYLAAGAQAFLQCFDAAELKRARQRAGSDLQFVQLLGADWPAADMSLAAIARYAQAIGPSLALVIGPDGQPTRLVPDAHAAGLAVHPWTFRADALPAGFTDFDALLAAHVGAGIDGLFTDFPDRVARFLDLSPVPSNAASREK